MPEWKLVGPTVPAWVKRSHLLRPVGFDSGRIQWKPMPASGPAWAPFDASRLPAGSRTLLMVHGTGLRTGEGFRGFSKKDFKALREIYGERIIAFEHRAFAHHVHRNARDLLRRLTKPGVRLELDVLGLSRGGLVTRWITEGWVADLPGVENIQIHKLIFVGTPNGGTPSARRDPSGVGAKKMKAWRTDVRRLTLVNKVDRDVEHVFDPFSVAGFEPSSIQLRTWPMLLGSQDQVPTSPVLDRLNGFAGPRPGTLQPTVYYGIASVFTFGHGAPNIELSGLTREQIADHALPGVANDLVVPTASVYAPEQGPDSSGKFPLHPERLWVLGPSSNASHTSLMLMRAVRRKILMWLKD